MTITLYVVFAALLGFGALVLISGELSKKRGPSRPGHTAPGRVALAAIMGFGVIGLSIKAVALIMLNDAPRLTDVAAASRSLPTQSHEFAESSGVQGIRYPGRTRSWQALPAKAPGTNPEHDTPELIALGRKLFFDTRLSSTGAVACASCHDIMSGGDDGQQYSTGIEDIKGGRNAPTVYNAAFLKRLFWDGRAKSLEDQATGPLMNPVEMGLSSPDEAVEIVNRDPDYVLAFRNALGGPVTIEGIATAIAAFERTLITNNSPYDRFVRGESGALTNQQMRGMYLFDKIGCRRCHQDPVFSVAGDPVAGPYRSFPVFKSSPYVHKHDLTQDKGRGGNGVWRVPSLRNVELTAPYFHNGAVETLQEAVRVMATAQLGYTIHEAGQSRFRVLRDEQARPVLVEDKILAERDIVDIAAFLESLTGAPNPSEPVRSARKD